MTHKSTTKKLKVVKSIKKSKNIKAINECSFKASNFLKDLINNRDKDNSFQVIKKEIDSINVDSENIIFRGTSIFMNCITRKLKKIRDQSNISTYEARKIQRRIEYFKSDECFENFQYDIIGGHYSNFLNDLFKVTLDTHKWRPMLANGRDEMQCNEIFSDSDEFNDYCYLCGNVFGRDAPRSCEHLLPIVSALCHLWIVKTQAKYRSLSSDSKELIKKEYAWAHKCCNKAKSSIELIEQDEYGEYEVADTKIDDLLEKINDECYSLDSDEVVDNVKKRFQDIVDIINENVTEYGSDYYSLFMKYKIIAALSDKNFEKLITGGFNGGNPDTEIDAMKKINSLDALVNIIKSEYLTNVIIKDIDDYVNEIKLKFKKKEELIETIEPVKQQNPSNIKKFIRPTVRRTLTNSIVRQQGGKKKTIKIYRNKKDKSKSRKNK